MFVNTKEQVRPELKTRALLPFFLLVTMNLVGCKNIGLPEGHLEGSLVQRKDDPKLPAPFFQIEKQGVSIDIQLNSNKSGATVEVKDLQKNVVSTISVSNISNGKFQLHLPGFPHPFELTSSGDCYVHSSQFEVLVCFTDDQFRLEVGNAKQPPIYTLVGNRFSKEEQFQIEAPVQLTLTEAVKTALKKNFSSAIEFQHAFQARHLAKAAWLNLLPRIGGADPVSVLPDQYMTLFGSVGDLAPFLFPNRWFQAKSASLESQAQLDANAIMRADLATSVEGLSYALTRDQKLAEFYSTALEKGQKALEKCESLEKSGKLERGSLETFKTILNGIKFALTSYTRIVQEDKRAIAQSLGFHNPEGLQELVIDSESVSIEAAQPLHFDEVLPVVLARSLELRQIDYLIQAAQFSRLETIFSWLDPSGEPSKDLGFAYRENILVANSKVQEIKIRRDKLKVLIAAKLERIINSHNFGASNYGLIKESRSLQESRLESMLHQLEQELTVDMMDVQAVFQDYLNAAVIHENQLADYRVSRANLDRLLLLNFYGGFKPPEDSL